MDLQKYNDKRDFRKTPEPMGDKFSGHNTQRFVVQRHQARKLHYDLRLEINGTLKSWAVPKGPSMNPNDKRLAIRTEDHPISYLHFYGTIPKGNYGAGEMNIWDTGTFEIDRAELDMSAHEQLQRGNLKLIFFGKYLKGQFALVETGERNAKESWLLIKKKDTYATDFQFDAEALIGKETATSQKKSIEIHPNSILRPMLASSKKEIFNDPEWIYELKWDGYRVLAHRSEKGVLLQSRNGINLNSKFPVLAEELKQLEHDTILDGEVVILDSDGVSQFGELQNYPTSIGVLKFYVFDMLYLNGHSMLELPLLDRKSLITDVIAGLEITQLCDHIEGMGIALFQKATEAGMEGVMAKRKDSSYTPGARTEKWLKVKSVESIDTLICGYTDSVEGGAAFGSLILGTKEKDTLKYVGNCGSGFGELYRKKLLDQFQSLRTDKNPFGKKLALKGRKPNWMIPGLACEVNYSQLTKNGILRNPVFKKMIGEPLYPETQSTTAFPKKRFSSSKETIRIDGLPVPISNIDKIYWPESGLTKYDLIDYYLGISETILPYLIDRPQSLHRHPNGISQEGFYQKDNESLPEWVETTTIYSKSSKRNIEYLLCQNTASLVYMANLGCIEINPWNSRTQHLEYPDYGIIDLDPPTATDFDSVIPIAKEFKNLLNELEISAFCKTSGSKGLHIYLPMGGEYTYEETRNFIKLLCYFVSQRLPKIATLERRIKNRKGKVYLDYLQNRMGHTIASAYAVRPLPGAPISAPIQCDELKAGLNAQKFTINNISERMDEVGDLFESLFQKPFDMETVLQKLNDIED